ncbi:MAG: hypothetical protein UY05_C0068G0004 [Candidatus Peregrinibacteria bacterium GW2011_GWA2_47_7]|nr:MAG: hypothetical protein UY05_C0068G0004 [Candidatus Peregrinibacteria bacterium GW2011_GWA2_47_7]
MLDGSHFTTDTIHDTHPLPSSGAEVFEMQMEIVGYTAAIIFEALGVTDCIQTLGSP